MFCVAKEEGNSDHALSLEFMARKKKQESDEPKKKTIYTIKIDEAQMDQVKTWCDKRMWSFYEVEYAHFGFKGDGVNIVGYKSGKLVVQGKKTEDWVTYVLEAEITQTPQLGYDEVHHPEWFEHHAGLDESGKGDLFGPLVTACVIADKSMIDQWREKGIQDSKRVTSDKAILTLEKIIRGTKGVTIKVMSLRMAKYNELYRKFDSNLNNLLAWMHAKCLQAALDVERVPWGMLDQFSKKPLVQEYFKDDEFELRMQTKAEADPVVAAASIIARAEYVKRINALSQELGYDLLKGASKQVKEQGIKIVEEHGEDALENYAKMHFKTAYEVLGKTPPAKKPWHKY